MGNLVRQVKVQFEGISRIVPSRKKDLRLVDGEDAQPPVEEEPANEPVPSETEEKNSNQPNEAYEKNHRSPKTRHLKVKLLSLTMWFTQVVLTLT